MSGPDSVVRAVAGRRFDRRRPEGLLSSSGAPDESASGESVTVRPAEAELAAVASLTYMITIRKSEKGGLPSLWGQGEGCRAGDHSPARRRGKVRPSTNGGPVAPPECGHGPYEWDRPLGCLTPADRGHASWHPCRIDRYPASERRRRAEREALDSRGARGSGRCQTSSTLLRHHACQAG